MAYTSVIPVHRLDRSIEYVKDKEKTTQKADSLEAAIDYARGRGRDARPAGAVVDGAGAARRLP